MEGRKRDEADKSRACDQEKEERGTRNGLSQTSKRVKRKEQKKEGEKRTMCSEAYDLAGRTLT